MKIGILSDTHGSYIQTKKALDAMGPCDAIIHLGDVLYHGPRNPLYETYEPARLAAYLKDKDILYVKGNCDADVDSMVTGRDISQKERFIRLNPLVLYCIHGYEKNPEDWIKRAKELGANTLCYGHTHVKHLEEREGITILNPGSTTLPKDGTPSCALYQDGRWQFIIL